MLFCLDYYLHETLSSWECLSLLLTSFPFVPLQKSSALRDNCFVYSTSPVSNNYLGSNNCSVENNFQFTYECLVSYWSSVYTSVCKKHYPVENVYLYTSRHFPLVPVQKSSALSDNCLVYSTSLISNNYLGSNKSSVDNDFHSLVNFLFPIALLFWLCVCMKHYPVENVYLYTSRHFPLVLIQKSSALCDNCLVYSVCLISNNYLGSKKCSVDNNFHFSSECFFHLLFYLDYVRFNINLRSRSESLNYVPQLTLRIFNINLRSRSEDYRHNSV